MRPHKDDVLWFHEHAVAKRAVEALNEILANERATFLITQTANDALAEIEASGWTP